MAKQPDKPLALTITDVARELQVSRSVAYELVASGRIPSFRPTPKRIRVARAVLERWVIEQSKPQPGSDTQPRG